jgi:hypothetical protein
MMTIKHCLKAFQNSAGAFQAQDEVLRPSLPLRSRLR